MTKAIDDQILDKLSLENRYSFLNSCMDSILKPEEKDFLNEVELFCLKFEKENNVTHGPDEDIYNWIGAFGKEGYNIVYKYFSWDAIAEKHIAFYEKFMNV